MSVSDPIADMLTKIRNASLAKHSSTVVPASNTKMEICKILKDEGYISSFKTIEDGSRKFIKILLKYDSRNNSVIKNIKKLSTPGRRVYSGYKEMPRILNGYGVIIVSTSSGIITGRKAREAKVGGELICAIW